MAFRVTCPECGELFRVPEEQAGQKARCKKCGAKFVAWPSDLAGVPAGGVMPAELDDRKPPSLGDWLFGRSRRGGKRKKGKVPKPVLIAVAVVLILIILIFGVGGVVALWWVTKNP